jgi:hypothetical protein
MTDDGRNYARYAIIEALRNGELRFDELSKKVRGGGFTQASFERARAQLHDEGKIERLGGGAAGPLRWQLTPFSRSPSASSESAAAPKSGRKKHGWRNFAIIVGIFLVGFFALLIVVGNYAQNTEQETSYMTRPGGTFTPEPADTPSATPEQTTASSGLVGKTLHVPSDMSVYGFVESEESGLHTYIETGYVQGWDAADDFARGAVDDHVALDLSDDKVKVINEDDSFTQFDQVTQQDETVPLCLVYVADADANYWVRCSSVGD